MFTNVLILSPKKLPFCIVIFFAYHLLHWLEWLGSICCSCKLQWVDGEYWTRAGTRARQSNGDRPVGCEWRSRWGRGRYCRWRRCFSRRTQTRTRQVNLSILKTLRTACTPCLEKSLQFFLNNFDKFNFIYTFFYVCCHDDTFYQKHLKLAFEIHLSLSIANVIVT